MHVVVSVKLSNLCFCSDCRDIIPNCGKCQNGECTKCLQGYTLDSKHCGGDFPSKYTIYNS